MLAQATDPPLSSLKTRPDAAMAVWVPYLKLCGYVYGGWLMARAADLAAAQLTGAAGQPHAAKLGQIATFYAAQAPPGRARSGAAGGSGRRERGRETDAALI